MLRARLASPERQTIVFANESERERKGGRETRENFGANFEAANCDEVKVKLDKFPLGKQFVKLLSHFQADD